ncbi:hypothetical protein CPB84DRAFT_1959747 [Gymnopilus junonius]|uniref:F-box domain-containing protein n=1 Tax=Gymnopilus junonius TaxID=109634 RepID=A0A9P5NVT4_GYMJU|nr:hypothetical protein CPB84DRAFT_1959747 [Gymnopilus junonius]
MSSFLSRRRSLQPFHFIDKEREKQKVEAKPSPGPVEAPATRPPPLIPSAAVENVPQKRYRTTSTSIRIISRVSSIFTPRKKAPPPDLDLLNSSLNNSSRRPSFSSSIDTIESDDDIRRPSGLGSAVSISSRRSFGHSPPASPARYGSFPARDLPRTRAISSPNLLRSLSWKVKKPRYGSIAPSPVSPTAQELPPPLPQSPKPVLHLPEEVIVLILSHLPKSNVRSLAAVSRIFASASRSALYGSLEFDSLSPEQAEKLVANLVSRRELTDLVTTLTCRKWPPFFLADVLNQNPSAIVPTDYAMERKNALLTASFTLALERMSNLRSLTLPSFDFSLLSHHTAFGLQSLTFTTHSMTDAELKALFAWLDGQTNIIFLRFMNLEDTPSSDNRKSQCIPHDDNTRIDFLAPSGPYLKPILTSGPLTPYSMTPSSSPHSAHFTPPSLPPSPIIGFESLTLLPNLTTLHATPALATLLTSPFAATLRRTLRSVTLNINTTLYNGLRPAALMNSLRGILHLSLRFSDNVDKRSIEKILGATGAALGAFSKPVMDELSPAQGHTSEVEWLGLCSLEVSFRCRNSGREEALYKSLQGSLARYKALSSLCFSSPLANDPQSAGVTNISTEEKIPLIPSTLEQAQIDCWIKQCPTLASITLFSGTQFHQTADQLQFLLQEQKRRSKANLLENGATFKFP